MNEISVRPRTPPPLPKPPPPTRSHLTPPAADDARRPCEDQPEYHPPPRLSPPSAPAAPPTRCLTFHSPCAQACTTRSSRWSRPRSPRRSRVRTRDTPTLHMPPLRVHEALSAAPLPGSSGSLALHGHRVAGPVRVVERGPLGAVRPPPCPTAPAYRGSPRSLPGPPPAPAG